MFTIIDLILIIRNRIKRGVTSAVAGKTPLGGPLKRLADIRYRILLILLIFALFFDIIFIQLIQARVTGNANLIATAAVLLASQDEETLEKMGIDPEKAKLNFGNLLETKDSDWVADQKLLLRQRTMKIFDKTQDGTFFEQMPYAVYGVGLCEAGQSSWYEYNQDLLQETAKKNWFTESIGKDQSDKKTSSGSGTNQSNSQSKYADPLVNLVGTGKEYNLSMLEDENTWKFKDQTERAVGPVQYLGIYGQYKMRYEVNMDYDSTFDVKDRYNGGSVDVQDDSSDQVDFVRPNPLYIPDVAYNYGKAVDDMYKDLDMEKYYPDFKNLQQQQQILLRQAVAFDLYGWGQGNVSEADMTTFITALGNWLANNNAQIQNIVDYKKYWNSSKLVVQDYRKSTLQTWITQTLGVTVQQRIYEGLYHVVLGYIEWQNLEDMIAAAEKQQIVIDKDQIIGEGDLEGRKKVVAQALSVADKGVFSYMSPGTLKGTGPNDFTVGNQLDCQSFVQWCYWSAGYTFEASNTRNYTGTDKGYAKAQDLTEITKDQVQLGDLQVVVASEAGVGTGHVWMYVGNGTWAECTPDKGATAQNYQMGFMQSHTSHYFQYTAFLQAAGGSGQGGSGSSGVDTEWQNPVPGYSRVQRRYYAPEGKGYHGALDICAAIGTPIYAAHSGTVILTQVWDGSQVNDMQSYGNMVRIQHGANLYTVYAHMQTIMAVQGSEVKAGDLIGYVGSTGNSTGGHCHFEIQTGSGTYTSMRKDPDAPDPALAALGVPQYTQIVP